MAPREGVVWRAAGTLRRLSTEASRWMASIGSPLPALCLVAALSSPTAEGASQRIQLGAFSEPARALRHWQRLRADHGVLIDTLSPCLQPTRHLGQPLFRLQLRGSRAHLVCDLLRGEGEACYPVADSGACQVPPQGDSRERAVGSEVVAGARVQLGAYRTRDNALARWHQLRGRQSLLEGAGTPCLQVAESPLRPAPLYRLQLTVTGAGPQAGSTLCQRLRAAGVDCAVVGEDVGACVTDPALAPYTATREASPPLPAVVPRAPLLAPPAVTGPPRGAVSGAAEDLFPSAVAEGVSMLPRKVQQQSLVEFDIDDPPKTVHPIAPYLHYGMKVSLETKLEQDSDLDHQRDDRRLAALPELELAFSYTPASALVGYLELELQKRYYADHPQGRKREPTELSLQQFYLLFDDWLPGWSVQVGRQAFEDEREWLYDEELDGVRAYYRHRRFGAELSFTREALLQRDLLNDDGDPAPINNLMLLGRYAYSDDGYVDGYLFWRNPLTDEEEELHFFGVHGQGELTHRLDYWLELALVRGEDPDRGRDIRGYGFDVGLTWEVKRGWRPSMTLGVAMGSGDERLSDGEDGNFRQTGLQDNNDRFNGVTGFKYYGEVFDPELSNLQILTLGVGVRPQRSFSLDLVWHRFWQHRAVDELRDSRLRPDPDGVHRYLGDELDAIFGYRFTRFSINWILGVFWPGDAFDDDADRAFLTELELGWRY